MSTNDSRCTLSARVQESGKLLTSDWGNMAFRILAFIFPLGLDTFAVAIALGLRGFRPWRPALLFCVFEAVMPLFGIVLARMVSLRFETLAVVIGGLLLIGMGVHAVREACQGKKEVQDVSFGSLRSSLLAGLAISMDELAIGFPLGASRLPIGVTLGAIAVQTVFITAIGVRFGNRVRSGRALRVSRYAGIAAGVVFALVGLWLVAEHFVRG
jgi:putative Mn2+ efflux pump MntP